MKTHHSFPSRKVVGSKAAGNSRLGRKEAAAPATEVKSDQFKSLITEAVKAAIPANSGVTIEQVQKCIDDAFTAAEAKKTKFDKDGAEKLVAGIVDSVKALKPAEAAKPAKGTKGADAEETELSDEDLADAEGDSPTVKGMKRLARKAKEEAAKAAAAPKKELTVDVVTSIVQEAVKGIKFPSRKEHDMGGDDDGHITIPDGDRVGNLSVCHKQILNITLSKGMNEGIPESTLSRAARKGDRELDRLRGVRYGGGYKALTVGGAGSGAEWVPSDLSSTLYRRLYLESPLAQYMQSREIVMPTDNYTFPLITTRPKFYGRANSTTIANQTSAPGTGGFTLIAKKLMAQVELEYELEEDSIIPVIPQIEESLGLAAADAWESCIVNGDTTATHQDSDIDAISNAPEKLFVGLRKQAISGNIKVDMSTGSIVKANLKAMRKKMGKYGKNPRDLVWLCGINGYNEMINLDEVFTLDKFGNRATVQTGELFFYKGIQIMVCSGIREDLNASGVYDGVTTTKGSIMLAYLPHYVTGRRRDFTLEMDKDISKQTRWLVASFRKAFQAQETPTLASGITPIVVGYNYNA